MPRPPKPREIRANREKRDIGEVQEPAGEIVVPPPPPGLLLATRTSWERFWHSAARSAVVASLDLDGLERLWTLYDERERAYRELRRPQRDAAGKAIRGTSSRVVTGSMGQERPSGFYAVIARLDASILQLEDRVAKSMKSRLTLGLVVAGDGHRTDEHDDPGARPAVAPDDAGDVPADPRLYVLDGGAR